MPGKHAGHRTAGGTAGGRLSGKDGHPDDQHHTGHGEGGDPLFHRGYERI